ncbi:MAG: triosephosphate isomerase [Euryarchaeota archaeon]|jgi:triosephosphate isomerase|nr:triosephosphate isomerase [Euryarchaeota archaeon]MBT4407521.1 triosephosphate isomerase [Euryarchaeota archaeon]MBT6644671.1 triosephosphate isomerase [Euryarchaeota archaeon]
MQSNDAPLVVVNAKTYASAQGDGADSLASLMSQVEAKGVRMVLCVSAFDLSSVAAANANLEVWAQHLDPVGLGSHTGWLQPDTAIHRGAVGTLINHAEHKVEMSHVASLLSQLDGEIPVCACAADLDEAKALAAMNPSPTFIAVEPPELIGGDISVTSADPKIISDTVALVKSVNPNVRVLCGAGVKTGEDVLAALELGAEGVLLASGVTKSADPKGALEDLLSKLPEA